MTLDYEDGYSELVKQWSYLVGNIGRLNFGRDFAVFEDIEAKFS